MNYAMLSHFLLGSSPKTIVLLHGLCEDKSIWIPLMLQLADSFRVVAFDLPGFGESPMPNSVTHIDDIAQMVMANLGGLKISQPVVIGHSYGGYVALSLAEQFGSQLAGLGLFHSTVYADSEEKKAQRAKASEFIERYGVRMYVENLMPGLFATHARARLAVKINTLTNRALSIKPEDLRKTISLMASRPDRSAAVQSLHCPMLYIIGKQDTAVPFDKSHSQLALPPHTLVQILDDVGHMGFLEAPKRVLPMIEFFAQYCYSAN